ncbi:AP2/ERF and B3 domain-containing transcription factor At1g51120-like [Rhodamnia argentea]|uniref:AP2/ERF and B3 domain-containing transcription factor At1g51120-like n=1 Tax=Rhodamnia argentea TaxID=178133 RepID=A0A8B8NFV8_9MYRT|nr:AP2/ERF and B3 domain-containing transcription factor At1g51120-like [Rhodamnia argentea]
MSDDSADSRTRATAETAFDLHDDREASDTRKRPRSSGSNDDAPSAKFVGVVPQPNGNWGAQIYANQQRIWLGTFRTEREAAMAYDSASIKLRRGDSQRNLPWTKLSKHEHEFQDNLATEVVLDMIRAGMYRSRLMAFLRNQSGNEETAEVGTNPKLRSMPTGGQYSCRQLFQKELTPSDVGKLNRLVIPKKYAVQYFPGIIENAGENALLHGGTNDLQLVLYDKLMKSWKFRYCYWKSSQSFVFTRGWNWFVKEKKLKAKDIVVFYSYDCSEIHENYGNVYLIDVQYNGHHGRNDNEGINDLNGVGVGVELPSNLGKKSRCTEAEHKEELEEETAKKLEGSSFRLFGVQMN